MPFKSQAQRRYLFKFHPAVAKEFASKAPNLKGLPEYAKTNARSNTQRKRNRK